MSDQDHPPESASSPEECPPDSLLILEHRRKDVPVIEFPPDARLVAEGWQRRFMADPIRAKESTRLYTELGYEVLSVAIEPAELSEICGACRLVTCRTYVTIYTRKLDQAPDKAF